MGRESDSFDGLSGFCLNERGVGANSKNFGWKGEEKEGRSFCSTKRKQMEEAEREAWAREREIRKQFYRELVMREAGGREEGEKGRREKEEG